MKVGVPLRQVEVVFCGNSLYLCGLAASLQHKEQFRICMLEHKLVHAVPELKMLWPDVLIIETVNADSEILSSLRQDYQIAIIVIDPKTDSIEVSSGDRSYTSSVDNLQQVITDAVVAQETPCGRTL